MPSIIASFIAGVRNTLPSRAEAGRSDHVPAVWSAGCKPVAGGPRQFDLVAAATPEDEDVGRTSGSSFSAVCTFAGKTVGSHFSYPSGTRQPARFWSRKVTGSSLQFLYQQQSQKRFADSTVEAGASRA